MAERHHFLSGQNHDFSRLNRRKNGGAVTLNFQSYITWSESVQADEYSFWGNMTAFPALLNGPWDAANLRKHVQVHVLCFLECS
jgi:hypothetical protein